MNEYRIRNGIVLESICGKYVLISTEAARDKCSYIRKIDDIVAYYWEMMEEGLSLDDMVSRTSSLFKDVDTDEIRKDIVELTEQLKEMGYLLKDDEII